MDWGGTVEDPSWVNADGEFVTGREVDEEEGDVGLVFMGLLGGS